MLGLLSEELLAFVSGSERVSTLLLGYLHVHRVSHL